MSNKLFSKKMEADCQPPKVGRLHFSKDAERKLFFFMTLVMLVMGLLAKIGIW